MNETHVTIRGNMVADPDRITGAKGEFTTFRVAVNEFYRDQAGGGYVDGRSSFYKVVAYRAVGANVYQSLKKGMPVLIHGVLRMSQWQTSTGETRSAPEIEAINIGPDLRFGIATYQKVPGQRAVNAGPAAGVRPSWPTDHATTDPWSGHSTAPAGEVTGDSDADGAEQALAPSSGPSVEQQEVPVSGPLVEQQAS